MSAMMVVMMVIRRIRGLLRGGVTCPQCDMYLLTAAPFDKVDRMGYDTVGEKRLHVFPHGLDTPWECHYEGVFDSSGDWSG